MFKKYSWFAFLTNVLPALSLISLPPAAPASRIVASRALPTAWFLPHRVGFRVTTDHSNHEQLVKRRSGQQIPFQWCPEFWGNPPKLCSQCGGDTVVKGTCDELLVSGPQRHCDLGGAFDGCIGYYCKCSDDGGPDNNPKVTISTVIDGQTAMAVWEPLTLTDFAKLRASTTVTLSETATAGSASEVETIVAVVFAGGIAWFLAVQSGPAAAALALDPPTSRPEGSREDDVGCKSPKPKCSDCGGADAVGLCQSGDSAGCPCDKEEQKCDADNPPQCSACGGADNQSNCVGEGEKKGCKCCPDDDLKCSDQNCEGDNKGKCQSAMYKACKCNRIFSGTPVDLDAFYQPVPPALVTSAANIVFSQVWAGDTNLIPGFVTTTDAKTPYCIHAGQDSNRVSPKEWCACGKDYVNTYSLVTGLTPCPYNPTSQGAVVTFTTVLLKEMEG